MANGDPLTLGAWNNADSTTAVMSTSNGLDVQVGALATAIRAQSQQGGTGVFGAGEIGVAGMGDDAGVTGYGSAGAGVRGTSILAVGVYGVSEHVQYPYDPAVTAGGNGTGVVGRATKAGTGVAGYSNSGVGVIGSGGAERTGVLGSASAGIGVMGSASPGIALFLGRRPPNMGVLGYSQDGSGVVGLGPRGQAGDFWGHVRITGDLTVVGRKSAAVPHPDGTYRTLYCVEAPDSWFEDFGEARLEGGEAFVKLDPDYAVLIDTTGYHVFLTNYAPVQLYVRDRHAEGFEVAVIPNPNLTKDSEVTDTATFGYRIVGKRKDVAVRRFEKADAPRVPTGEEGPNRNEVPSPPPVPVLPPALEPVVGVGAQGRKVKPKARKRKVAKKR